MPYEPSDKIGALANAELATFLDEPWNGRIATITPEGWPYVAPVWYEFERDHGSFRRLVLDLARVGDPARGVEDLEREQVSVLVVVEDHAGLVLVAFCDRDALFQDDGQGIRPGVVDDFHDSLLQYLSILLVR